jgi:hypothetical protein
MKQMSLLTMLLNFAAMLLLLLIFLNNRVALAPIYKWMLVIVGSANLLSFIHALTHSRHHKPDKVNDTVVR